MNGTATRTRTGRRAARHSSYAGFVNGANALQLDPAVLAPPPVEVDLVPSPLPAAPPVGRPVAPPAPVALPRPAFLALVVALVVGGVLGVLLLNTKINQNSFRLDDLRAQQAALDLQEQQLSQQLAELESPGNLAAAARRLGLVPAGTPAFIRLPEGRVVGVPAPAGSPGR